MINIIKNIISFQKYIYHPSNMSEPKDTAPEEPNFPPPDQELDRLLGALVVIILAVGLVGNISALLYFWYNQHKSLPDKLYIAIIIVSCVKFLLFLVIATSERA